jgi:histidyl-tRNA synthetase
LQLNSIGSAQSRTAYRAALVEYLQAHVDDLDEDSQRRLLSNPLRILDSKNADTQAILDDAPGLEDFLDDESRADFARLEELLQSAGVNYVVNRRLVRGLDYYNKTVFEWVTDNLGAQGTICAGGRYDGLVQQLGGKATPAVGFAMGMERLVLLLQGQGIVTNTPSVDVFVVAVGDDAEKVALAETERFRQGNPKLCVMQHTGGGSLKSQMKKADKSGARIALIWAEDEVAAASVTVKSLRESNGERIEQRTIPVDELEQTLCAVLAH